MKKLFSLTIAAFGMIGMLSAQSDLNIFNHLAVGVNAGTTGIGLDAAMPACHFVQIRAGFDVLPKFQVDSHLNLSSNMYTNAMGQKKIFDFDRANVQGEPHLANGKILIDILPFIVNKFRLTVGAYFGAGNVMDIYNSKDGALYDIAQANNDIEKSNRFTLNDPQKIIGLELGDYLLVPDAQGNVNVHINTKSFRPYIGIGYGRTVPRHRVGCSIDFGFLIWDKPTVECNGIELTSENLASKGGSIIRTFSKIKVYPCLSLRLCGRIF